jgi:hypothetical protein
MENLMFSANFNTSAEDTLRLSNKDACTYTFQKLDACSKIRHLEITGVSPFSGETAYNSAPGVIPRAEWPKGGSVFAILSGLALRESW